VFSERVSSVARRDQLEAALDYCREGDVLIVTKLDRLARSMADLVAITSRVKAKGVALNILAMQLDTTTPTGKLMLQLMGCFAEFEREVMLERQREGVAKAKAEGKYKGRVPTAQRKSAEVVQLRGGSWVSLNQVLLVAICICFDEVGAESGERQKSARLGASSNTKARA